MKTIRGRLVAAFLLVALIPFFVSTYVHNTAAVVASTLVSVFLCTWLVSRRIRGSIQELKRAAESMASGELQTPIKTASNQDEIQSLATSLETMRLNLRESLSKYQDSLQAQRQLYEKVQQRLEEFSTLHRIAEAMNSTLSLQEVMQQALREMVQAFKAESGAIFLWDESEQTLTASETFGCPKSQLSMPPGKGVAGIIFEKNAPLLVNDVDSDVRLDASRKIRRNVKSILGTPLFVRDKVIGTVEIHHSIESYFKQESMKLLEVMSSSLAMAVDNARLYKESSDNLARRMEELFTLYHVTQVVSSSLNLPTVLNQVAELIVQTLRADAVCVTLMEGDSYRCYTGHRLPESVKDGFVSAMNVPSVIRSLESGVPLILKKVEEDPNFSPLANGPNSVKSIGVTPILVDRKLIGTIGIFFQATHRFNDEEARLLMALAQQGSIAIKNARLYQEAVSEKEMLNSIVSSMSDGVVTLDKELKILSANPAAEKILGWMAEEVVEKPFFFVFNSSENDAEFLHQVVRQGLHPLSPAPLYHEMSVKVKDGSEKFLSLVLSPFRQDSEALLGLVCVFRDISKVKEIEQMKSDFISTVSHELRTPLTSIKGYIATLLHPATKFDGATQRDFLQIMNREADRLSGLISDLLEVSRIESEKFRMNPRVLDLVPIVNQMVEKYRELNRKHTFEIGSPEALEVEIDGTQIEYVLHHLMSNAVKYSPKGGKIEVALLKVEDKIYVSVKDQGVGIPFDEQEKIFDRFHRVDNRPTRWAYGWGLGLFIVRKVVEAHGGRIWVESALGGGSKFTFTLPTLTKEEGIHDERQTSSRSGG